MNYEEAISVLVIEEVVDIEAVDESYKRQASIHHSDKCDFCAVAHRAIGKSMGANVDSLDALNQGKVITDTKDRAIAEFTISVVKNRGWVPEDDVQKFLAAGYTQQQILEVVLVVTIKTLSNYSNHFTKPTANKELVAML